MSLAIRRSSYTGDPGFFDFLKKGAALATSFIPGVGGGISQAIMGIGRQPPVPQAGPGMYMTSAAIPARASGTLGGMANLWGKGPQVGGCLPGLIRGPMGTCINLPFSGAPGAGFGPMQGSPSMAMATMNGGMNGKALSGYHWNKSDYFLKSGEYVPEGTRLVKNRKRNPANARATSRAISRIVGAKTYAKSLGRISVRKKC